LTKYSVLYDFDGDMINLLGRKYYQIDDHYYCGL